MPRAAFSNFLLSATYPEIGFQVFRTNTVNFSAENINNVNASVLALTSISVSGWAVTDKGSDAATLIFKAGQTNKNIGPFGFTVDPAPASYTYINHAWYFDNTGYAYVYENGVAITSASYTTDSEFKISHRNNNIGYFKDNTLIRQVSGVASYFYVGLTTELSQNNSSITNINYDRYNFINVQTAPLTVTFQPSSINFEDQFVSKIVYVMPDRVVTRNFTFSTLQDALTGSTKDIDSRSNYSYTFYSSPTGGNINYYVTVSATLFPSLSTFEYVIDIPVNTPRLTRNPSLPSSETFVFDSVHLLKCRAWGPNNNILFIAEGINHDNTSQLFLLSSSQ